MLRTIPRRIVFIQVLRFQPSRLAPEKEQLTETGSRRKRHTRCSSYLHAHKRCPDVAHCYLLVIISQTPLVVTIWYH